MATETLDSSVTGTYAIDPAHSRIGFVARHAMVTKVRGSFNDFVGSLNLDAENPSNSNADLTVQVASVDTRNEQRDGHLRTNDFFDAPAFPEIKFASTSVKHSGDNEFIVTGDLTIKDVTKPVDVEFEFLGTSTDPFGNARAGFEGKAKLNRTDFGVNFNAALETGGVLVSENITLEIEVSAIKQ